VDLPAIGREREDVRIALDADELVGALAQHPAIAFSQRRPLDDRRLGKCERHRQS
jgi:hypothetical protein